MKQFFQNNRNAAWGWIVLAAVLVGGGPLFVRTPLTIDTTYYDLQTWNLLRGGVLYRDFIEPNLPGVVWLHAVVRSVLGWSSEALRLFDLLLLTASVCLLSGWLKRGGRSHAQRVWTAVLIFGFYFSVSEWCHCQRDTWMLLAGLAALGLRHRQMRRLSGPDAPPRTVVRWAVLEGLCWGAAVWIKPHIAVPALACWCVSALPSGRSRRVILDLGGLLAGGLLAGSAGIAWLIHSEAWPYLVETLTTWNPEYFATSRRHWNVATLGGLGRRLFPWILVHFAAVPVAVRVVARAVPAWRAGRRAASDSLQPAALLAVFYLGWLAQVLVLQYPFDYVHVPLILLAITLCTGFAPWVSRPAVARLALAGVLATALLISPALRPQRLACWPDCFTDAGTSELRDRLASFTYPDFSDLDGVAAFLDSQDLADGELTCWNNSAIGLYRRLGIRPATRYAFVRELAMLFPGRKDVMLRDLAVSRHRYVISDWRLCGVSPDGADLRPAELTDGGQGSPPWCWPVVFRSGRYAVHRVPQPEERGLTQAALAQQSAGR